MLAQLTSKQIAEWWPRLKPCLEQVLPPFTYADPHRMNNILQFLLLGEMHCWLAQTIQENEGTIHGFAITTFSTDECSGVKNLMIYALYGFNMYASVQVWDQAWEVLKAFAKQCECHRVTAFTDSKNIVQHAARMGWKAEYAFLTYEVA